MYIYIYHINMLTCLYKKDITHQSELYSGSRLIRDEAANLRFRLRIRHAAVLIHHQIFMQPPESTATPPLRNTNRISYNNTPRKHRPPRRIQCRHFLGKIVGWLNRIALFNNVSGSDAPKYNPLIAGPHRTVVCVAKL